MKKASLYRRSALAVLCAAAMIGAFFTSAFAAGLSVAAERKTLRADAEHKTVTVELKLEGNTAGVAGGVLTVTFDKALKVKEIKEGKALEGLTFTPSGDLNAEGVRLVWAGTDAVFGNGTLAELTFEVPLKTASYPIALYTEADSFYDNDLNDLAVALTDGVVEVELAPGAAEETQDADAEKDKANPTEGASDGSSTTAGGSEESSGAAGASGTEGDPAGATGGTAAQKLYALSLFKGVGTNEDGTVNFDLDRAPTRTEALVMLIRLLGREAEATEGTWSHPFTDVASWADKYVGYAYEKKLTNGISDVLFGANDKATGAMYVTFVLRAMGWSDAQGEFTWDKPQELAAKCGFLSADATLANFRRGDAAVVSAKALGCRMKDGAPLYEKLAGEGVFTVGQYQEVMG